MVVIRALTVFTTLAVLLQVQGGLINNISGRIINGETATQEYEYHAHLLMDNPNEATRVGSGVVITRRLILTVAQNIAGFASFRAGFGNIVRAQLIWRDALLGEYLNTYNPVTLEDNIGFLFFMPGQLDIVGVTPITLPPAMFGDNLPLLNEQGRVVGFGHTINGAEFANHLQIAYKRVISVANCEATYPHRNMAQSFCANDTVSLGKICGGDQGGAFVTVVNGREFLTGISSYTLGADCVLGQPALLVRVLEYRGIIETLSSVFH